MAEVKTKATAVSVEDFIRAVPNDQRRKDAEIMVKMMTEVTGHPATMWGPSIIGFGKYHYKYESGHEGDMCAAGFSPRKSSLSVYIIEDHELLKHLLPKLGKHKLTKACLYINKLEDVDMEVLKEIVKVSYDAVENKVE